MRMEAVRLDNLYKIYKAGDLETVALRGASLSVAVGEFVAITGRSGAGKSTLLSLIGGLAVPSAGQVIVAGTDLARLPERERAIFRRRQMYQTTQPTINKTIPTKTGISQTSTSESGMHVPPFVHDDDDDDVRPP